MSYTKPEIVRGDWFEIETTGGARCVPRDIVNCPHDNLTEALAKFVDGPIEIWRWRLGAWGARMVAPGPHLDATEWTLFETKDGARTHLCKTYDLCHRCLEWLGPHAFGICEKCASGNRAGETCHCCNDEPIWPWAVRLGGNPSYCKRCHASAGYPTRFCVDPDRLVSYLEGTGGELYVLDALETAKDILDALRARVP